MNFETVCDDLVANTIYLVKKYDIPVYAIREAINKDLSDSSVRIKECKNLKYCPQDREFRDKIEEVCEVVRSLGGTVDLPNICNRGLSLLEALDIVHSLAMISVRVKTKEYFLERLQDLEVK